MRHRPPRSVTPHDADWPSTLRLLVRAAELECPPGHADTLRALTALALTKVPARGIFDPAARGDHELFAAIESVAQAHLELKAARTAWRAVLNDANLTLERRDGIEQAALEVQSISDTAYFYAGLAFGLTFVAGFRAG